MTGDKTFLQDYKELKRKVSITLGDGNTNKAVGVGQVQISSDGKLAYNLVSISKATASGAK
eukprot:189786-Chlamydomonas_euryale.AAC.1